MLLELPVQPRMSRGLNHCAKGSTSRSLCASTKVFGSSLRAYSLWRPQGVLAVLFTLTIASFASAAEPESPQAKLVREVHAETCRATTKLPLPESFWRQFDQSRMMSQFGKDWKQVKKSVSLNGRSGGKCWVEDQRGNLLVAGTVGKDWTDTAPLFTLYETRESDGRTLVAPAGIVSFGNDSGTTRWFNPGLYPLGRRVFTGDRTPPSYEYFSTVNYCLARSRSGYVAFTPSRTAKSEVVEAFKQAWAQGGTLYMRSDELHRYIETATAIQELDRDARTGRQLELDIVLLDREWPLRVVAEAGELVLALQMSSDGRPWRYWVFRVAATAGIEKIVPTVDVRGKKLEVNSTVASFEAESSTDFGKAELAALDAYCRAEK